MRGRGLVWLSLSLRKRLCLRLSVRLLLRRSVRRRLSLRIRGCGGSLDLAGLIRFILLSGGRPGASAENQS